MSFMHDYYIQFAKARHRGAVRISLMWLLIQSLSDADYRFDSQENCKGRRAACIPSQLAADTAAATDDCLTPARLLIVRAPASAAISLDISKSATVLQIRESDVE